MNTKLAITVSIAMLLCAGLIGQTLAQTRVPGVKSQDYLTYSLVAYWHSDNASQPVPESLIQVNQTLDYKVMISGVLNNVNVTATHTWDFKNGTTVPYLIAIDVESGTPYYLSGAQPPFEGIVGANLKAGDLLHPAGNDSVTVNQTITRNYADGPRDTNIVDLSSPLQNQTLDSNNQTVYTTIGNQDVTYFLDKATGVLVEQNTTLVSFVPSETATVLWTLKETNLWNAAPAPNLFLPIVIAVVVIAVVVVIAAVYRIRKRSNRKRR